MTANSTDLVKGYAEPWSGHKGLFRLDGRRALVIGAGSGIGRDAAHALAAHGAAVVCADRDLDAVTTTAAAIGGKPFRLDLFDRDAVRCQRRLNLDPAAAAEFGPTPLVVDL